MLGLPTAADKNTKLLLILGQDQAGAPRRPADSGVVATWRGDVSRDAAGVLSTLSTQNTVHFTPTP